MYNSIIKKLGSLSHSQLLLVREVIDTELKQRESLGPISYKCPDCDFEGQFGEVFAHLDSHKGYEDAVKRAYAPEEVYE